MFKPEDAPEEHRANPQQPWKALVVDDDPGVHEVTAMLLKAFFFRGRRLVLLHAMSAREAREIISNHPDIACMLVDVVMESDQAGLELVKHVREELGNREVQIIIRTGEPGKAPERAVIEQYEINDYQQKTEVTSDRLTTAMTCALRAYATIADTRLEEMARAEAERRLLAKSQFLAQMSHEIRTPMAGVVGLSEHMLGPELDDAQRAYVSAIHDSAQTLVHMIQDMLEFSGSGPDRPNLESVPFNLPDMINALLALFRPRILQQDLQLDISIDPDLHAPLCGDPNRLRQILTCLISNAVRFTDSGGIGIEASLRQSAESDHQVTLRFRISDTGCGISAAQLDRIFDPQLEPGANPATSSHFGQGLMISRRLCQMMGGDIRLVSMPGKGTTVSFSVQCRQPDQSSQSAAGIAADRGKKLRVLLVDDNRVNRMVGKAMLGKLGMEADLVENGKQAVERCEEASYDLILMDCQMPVMNGLEATWVIRRLPAYAVTPIIALTSSTSQQEREQCFSSGMSDYLVKPLELSQLKRALARHNLH